MTTQSRLDVYVVDVCGTLVRDDTTLGLLRYHFKHSKGRPFRSLMFGLMTQRGSPVWLGFAVMERLTGKHLLKHWVVKMLAGDRTEALQGSADQYAAILLKTRRVAAVRTLIDHPENIDRVLLASASLEPIVASLASALGARHVASQLEEKGGLLTGRYAKDLTGCKEKAMQEKFGQEALSGKVGVISDNFSDRSLLAGADKAWVVLHHPSHKLRWQGVDATFLDLDS